MQHVAVKFSEREEISHLSKCHMQKDKWLQEQRSYADLLSYNLVLCTSATPFRQKSAELYQIISFLMTSFLLSYK